MSENRDEILMDFQACTGIEDVGEAFSHLEAVQWDLLRAVHRVMPQDTQTLPSEATDDIEMIEPALPLASTAPDVPGPSTSSAPDTITFHISHGEQEFDFVVSKNDRIEYLKQLVGTKINVPSCRVDFQGWRRAPASDKVTFGELRCSAYNPLFVLVLDPSPDGVTAADEGNLIERLTQTFTLNIRDETNNKSYNLKFPGSRTVTEVKVDIFELTDIPVRHQRWTGWPPAVKDSVTLATSGISFPEHNLTLKRQTVAKDGKKKQAVVHVTDSDSSVGEYEDASESFNGDDDMLYIGTVETRKLTQLIPDNVEDEIAGSISFMEEYERRYGGSHPLFLQGTLDEAVKEAFSKPARERRPLVIYIHHDGSVLANVFCTQVLNSEPVISYLSEHFVIWGWDFTNESNKQMMLRSASQSLGPMASNVMRINQDHLPALVVANKIRSSTEIVSIMHGHLVVNELISNLMQVRDRFGENQTQEILEEDERYARERVLREQDEAYQASLELDRAKEEARRAIEVAKEREEQMLQSQQRKEAEVMESRKNEAASRLPQEPADVPGDNITRIRFRLPNGQFLTRRFDANSSLHVMFDYLLTEGYPQDEYKVLSSWPRRDLTALDSSQTLQSTSLCPQETVILEER